jgi:predicted transcriptional regulator
MSVTSLRISQDIEAPLENLAQRLDRSKNYLINQAIKEFIARQMMEDSRWDDTMAALESAKAGKLIDESQVTEWLQSWGTDKELSPPSL